MDAEGWTRRLSGTSAVWSSLSLFLPPSLMIYARLMFSLPRSFSKPPFGCGESIDIAARHGTEQRVGKASNAGA